MKVGKTGRTVSANEIEIQYVDIIGGPLLTYLFTGTDRLERTNVKEMNEHRDHSESKYTNLFSSPKKIVCSLSVKDLKIQ